ncbi:hypothetical protein [Desulfosarcina sp. BuS5]|nr:hypothetical protein [Desulfosarcina sp. BuS5]
MINLKKMFLKKNFGPVSYLIEEAQKSIQDDSEAYTLSFTAMKGKD